VTLLLLAAAFPRLMVFLLAANRPEACLTSDAYGYLGLAKNLWTYHAFGHGTPPVLVPETFRLPGYPLFLAPFTALFESPVLWIAFAQCLLGILTVMWLWHWLRGVTNDRSARVGALVLAVDWVIVFHTPMLIAETLVVFLQVLAMILTWRALELQRGTEVTGSGLLWGLTLMVKPVFLYFPLVLCWIWSPRKKYIFRFLLAAYLIPGVWILRNGATSNFWSLSSLPGFALFDDLAAKVIADATDRTWDSVRHDLRAQVDAKHPSGYRNDAERSQVYAQEAVHILKRHPFVVVKVWLIGAARMLGGTGFGLWHYYRPPAPQQNPAFWLIPVQIVYGFGLGVLYLLSVWGCIKLWRMSRKKEAYFLAAGVTYILLVASYPGMSRLRIPMMPFMAIAASFAVTKIPARGSDYRLGHDIKRS